MQNPSLLQRPEPARTAHATEPQGWARVMAQALDLLLPSPCACCDNSIIAIRPALGLCSTCLSRWPARTEGRCCHCGRAVTGVADDQFRCGDCYGSEKPYQRLIIGWNYLPPVSDTVQAFKFGRLEFIGKQLTDLLWEHLSERERVFLYRHDLVTCVPLSWSRHLVRGYNQSEVVARRLAKTLNLPYRPLLRRKRGAKPQSSLARKHRRKNIRGAFSARPRKVAARSVLLVDDVATTGTTLEEASNTLRYCGASTVNCLAVARTPHPNESASVEFS